MSGTSNRNEGEKKNYVSIAVDLILKLGALFVLIYFCIRILQPFMSMLIWGLIIAIILFPVFHKIRAWFGDRSKISSVLLTLLTLAILVLPSIWLVNQLVDGVRFLTEFLQEGEIVIPPPGDNVADLPLIGNWLYDNWLAASENLAEEMKGFLPQIASWAEKALGAIANTGIGVLQFAASIIIAGIFLVFFKEGSESGRKIFKKIIGERGDEFLEISLQTIRNVATGVLGVAIIQTTLMGLGFILSGLPLAAVWIVVVLIMTIAQIPVLIFNIPLIIYLFAFMDPLPAVLWTLYFLVMGMMDNVLKPMLMGKGASVPMLVIFLGALGGFAAFGFIGLFLGAIVLSLAYRVYLTWVNAEG